MDGEDFIKKNKKQQIFHFEINWSDLKLNRMLNRIHNVQVKILTKFCEAASSKYFKAAWSSFWSKKKKINNLF